MADQWLANELKKKYPFLNGKQMTDDQIEDWYIETHPDAKDLKGLPLSKEQEDEFRNSPRNINLDEQGFQMKKGASLPFFPNEQESKPVISSPFDVGKQGSKFAIPESPLERKFEDPNKPKKPLISAPATPLSESAENRKALGGIFNPFSDINRRLEEVAQEEMSREKTLHEEKSVDAARLFGNKPTAYDPAASAYNDIARVAPLAGPVRKYVSEPIEKYGSPVFAGGAFITPQMQAAVTNFAAEQVTPENVAGFGGPMLMRKAGMGILRGTPGLAARGGIPFADVEKGKNLIKAAEGIDTAFGAYYGMQGVGKMVDANSREDVIMGGIQALLGGVGAASSRSSARMINEFGIEPKAPAKPNLGASGYTDPNTIDMRMSNKRDPNTGVNRFVPSGIGGRFDDVMMNVKDRLSRFGPKNRFGVDEAGQPSVSNLTPETPHQTQTSTVETFKPTGNPEIDAINYELIAKGLPTLSDAEVFSATRIIAGRRAEAEEKAAASEGKNAGQAAVDRMNKQRLANGLPPMSNKEARLVAVTAQQKAIADRIATANKPIKPTVPSPAGTSQAGGTTFSPGVYLSNENRPVIIESADATFGKDVDTGAIVPIKNVSTFRMGDLTPEHVRTLRSTPNVSQTTTIPTASGTTTITGATPEQIFAHYPDIDPNLNQGIGNPANAGSGVGFATTSGTTSPIVPTPSPVAGAGPTQPTRTVPNPNSPVASAPPSRRINIKRGAHEAVNIVFGDEHGKRVMQAFKRDGSIEAKTDLMNKASFDFKIPTHGTEGPSAAKALQAYRRYILDGANAMPPRTDDVNGLLFQPKTFSEFMTQNYLPDELKNRAETAPAKAEPEKVDNSARIATLEAKQEALLNRYLDPDTPADVKAKLTGEITEVRNELKDLRTTPSRGMAESKAQMEETIRIHGRKLKVRFADNLSASVFKTYNIENNPNEFELSRLQIEIAKKYDIPEEPGEYGRLNNAQYALWGYTEHLKDLAKEHTADIVTDTGGVHRETFKPLSFDKFMKDVFLPENKEMLESGDYEERKFSEEEEADIQAESDRMRDKFLYGIENKKSKGIVHSTAEGGKFYEPRKGDVPHFAGFQDNGNGIAYVQFDSTRGPVPTVAQLESMVPAELADKISIQKFKSNIIRPDIARYRIDATGPDSAKTIKKLAEAIGSSEDFSDWNSIAPQRARGLSEARAEGGGYKASVNVERSIDNITRDYTSPLGGIMTREGLQNAFDAIKGLGADGIVNIRLAAKFGGGGSIEIYDNGTGLDDEALAHKLFEVFSSGKEGEEGASGGKGIGSASYMFGGTHFEIETVAIDKLDGKKYRIIQSGTPVQHVSGKGKHFERVEVPSSTQTGTRVKTELKTKHKIDDARAMVDHIIEHTRDKKFTMLYDADNFTKGTPLDEIEVETDENKFGPTEHKFKKTKDDKEIGDFVTTHRNSQANVSIAPFDPAEKRDTIKIHYLNTGMYQFTNEIYIGKSDRGVPEHVIVNLTPLVDEMDEEYPFINTREDVKKDIRAEVERFLEENIKAPAIDRRKNRVRELYDAMSAGFKQYPGMVRQAAIFDPGDRMTAVERKEFAANPATKDLIKFYDRLLYDVLDKVGNQAWIDRLEAVGIVLDPGTHGIHIPNVKTRKSSILFNPFHKIDDESPEDAAFDGIVTALHEAGHIGDQAMTLEKAVFDPDDLADPRVGKWFAAYLNEERAHGDVYRNTGHGVAYLQRLGEVFSKYGLQNTFKFAFELEQIYTKGAKSGGYRTEIQELLQIYKESRGRDETTEDLLSREGVKQAARPGSKKDAISINTPDGDRIARGQRREIEPLSKEDLPAAARKRAAELTGRPRIEPFESEKPKMIQQFGTVRKLAESKKDKNYWIEDNVKALEAERTKYDIKSDPDNPGGMGYRVDSRTGKARVLIEGKDVTNTLYGPQGPTEAELAVHKRGLDTVDRKGVRNVTLSGKVLTGKEAERGLAESVARKMSGIGIYDKNGDIHFVKTASGIAAWKKLHPPTFGKMAETAQGLFRIDEGAIVWNDEPTLEGFFKVQEQFPDLQQSVLAYDAPSSAFATRFLPTTPINLEVDPITKEPKLVISSWRRYRGLSEAKYGQRPNPFPKTADYGNTGPALELAFRDAVKQAWNGMEKIDLPNVQGAMAREFYLSDEGKYLDRYHSNIVLHGDEFKEAARVFLHIYDKLEQSLRSARPAVPGAEPAETARRIRNIPKQSSRLGFRFTNAKELKLGVNIPNPNTTYGMPHLMPQHTISDPDITYPTEMFGSFIDLPAMVRIARNDPALAREQFALGFKSTIAHEVVHNLHRGERGTIHEELWGMALEAINTHNINGELDKMIWRAFFKGDTNELRGDIQKVISFADTQVGPNGRSRSPAFRAEENRTAGSRLAESKGDVEGFRQGRSGDSEVGSVRGMSEMAAKKGEGIPKPAKKKRTKKSIRMSKKRKARERANAIGKLHTILDATPALRLTMEEKRKIARSQRLEEFYSVRRKGVAGMYEKMSKLKGKLPEADFKSIAQHFSEAEMQVLVDMVHESDVYGFGQAAAFTGLMKIFNEEYGQIPTWTEQEYLGKIFGKKLEEKLNKMRGDEGFVNVRDIPEAFKNITKSEAFGKIVKWTDTRRIGPWYKQSKTPGVDVLDGFKALILGVDAAAPGRQGLALIHRREFRESFGPMFNAMWDEDYYREFQKGMRHKILKKLADNAGLELTSADSEKGKKGSTLNKTENDIAYGFSEALPVAGRLIRGSNRGAVVFLNNLRMSMFESLVMARYNHSPEITAETMQDLKDIARYINIMTGRGNIGKLKIIAPVLNRLYFSVPWVASRMQMLDPRNYYSREFSDSVLDYDRIYEDDSFLMKTGKVIGNAAIAPIPFKKTLKGKPPKFLVNEYRKSMAALLAQGGILMGFTAALYYAGAPMVPEFRVETNPKSGKFMQTYIGNGVWLDFFGGIMQYAVLGTRLATGEMVNAEGKTVPFGRYAGGQGPTRWSTLDNWQMNKTLPYVEMIRMYLEDLNRQTGKPPTEEDYKNKAIKGVTPISAQDLTELAMANPWMTPWILYALLGGGINVQDARQPNNPFKAPTPGGIGPVTAFDAPGSKRGGQ